MWTAVLAGVGASLLVRLNGIGTLTPHDVGGGLKKA